METNSEIIFFNLEKVRFILKDACGLDIGYAYEDLVFAEHGLFIIQFDHYNPELSYCWFQHDIDHNSRRQMWSSLQKTAELNTMDIQFKGFFTMEQKEGSEEIDLAFTPTFNL